MDHNETTRDVSIALTAADQEMNKLTSEMQIAE